MKRIYVILLTLLGCILVTLGLSVLFLKSGRIQTAAVRLATDELSRGLNTQVSIGSVQYDFPMRITLKDIYIEDQQQDTLLYIKDFYTRFSPLALRNQHLRFPAIELDTIRANIYQLPSGDYNYQFLIDAFASQDTTKFLIDAFASQDTTTKPFNLHVELRHIKLANAHLTFDTIDVQLPTANLALHHLCADSLDAEIHNLTSTVNVTSNSIPFEPTSISCRQGTITTSSSSMPLLRKTLLRTSTIMPTPYWWLLTSSMHK